MWQHVGRLTSVLHCLMFVFFFWCNVLEQRHMSLYSVPFIRIDLGWCTHRMFLKNAMCVCVCGCSRVMFLVKLCTRTCFGLTLPAPQGRLLSDIQAQSHSQTNVSDHILKFVALACSRFFALYRTDPPYIGHASPGTHPFFRGSVIEMDEILMVAQAIMRQMLDSEPTMLSIWDGCHMLWPRSMSDSLCGPCYHIPSPQSSCNCFSVSVLHAMRAGNWRRMLLPVDLLSNCSHTRNEHDFSINMMPGQSKSNRFAA